MKHLDNKGLTIVEVIVAFSVIMIVLTGLLTIIMNYRYEVQASYAKLELQTYKNTLTKEIQDDLLTLGLAEINDGGKCTAANNVARFSECINIVFKDGTEKILAVSKIEPNNRNLLENKYIYYDSEKHVLNDELPPNDKIPAGRSLEEFQTIYIANSDFVSSDTAHLSDGKEIKIYTIDIPIEHIDYEEDFGIHIVTSNADFLSTNVMVSEFGYIEDASGNGVVQQYVVPIDGTYFVELWGASGGDVGPYRGGQGAYTSGYISLKKDQILYVLVGGQGSASTKAGFNGGDAISAAEVAKGGSTGGGATDVRVVSGNWNSFASLKSRIMVAAGGGGASYRNITSDTDAKMYGVGDGGAGGGLVGYDGDALAYEASVGYSSADAHYIGGGAIQSAGGVTKQYNSANTLINPIITGGGFGKGVSSNTHAGGGGGWYTGSYGNAAGGGGGSSYISGHNGCEAVNQSSTETNVTHKAISEYDGYVFFNTTMIDGNGYLWKSSVTTEKKEMPTTNFTTIENGNVGNGYARISYLGL